MKTDKPFQLPSHSLAFAAVLACMVLIFFFSAQPVGESRQTSGKLVLLIDRLFAKHLQTMTSSERAGWIVRCTRFVRKTAHLLEFAALGASFAWYFCVFDRLTDRRRLFFAWAAALLYAVSDELHQFFVPGRGPGALDVLIDAAGALAGAGVAVCTARRLRKRRAGAKES